ncbi:MAG: shikimate dehydrogenase [Candidatus Omnitrophica bacterium CG07_land_8_20_14_0_80_50_8]|nr:MAG: shikimate dehydrogenase [Candidatus Omnitrophica bacterium CG07_land_8_20_14_0_80_50_8]
MKVAFIAHPLNIGMFSVMAGESDWNTKLFKKETLKQRLRRKKPFAFLELNGLLSKTGAKIDLVAIACPFLPDQMIVLDEKEVLEKIIQSVNLAKKEGAEIVSLGGFTSVIGNEGEKVAKVVNIAVTSGNTYTASLAIQGILSAADLVGRDLKKSHIAVFGATGDIGSACARVLAKKAHSMSFVARNEKKLDGLASEISKENKIDIQVFKTTEDATKKADIIISATSALTTIIDPKNLKKGAIVCDVALPANIAREVSRIRKDVLVFEGGLSSVPFIEKIQDKKWCALMPQNGIYGCLAEALLLGFESKKENYSIGRGNITEEKLTEIWKIAQKHGLGLSEFFCGDKFYTKEEIAFLYNISIRKGEEAHANS